MCVYMLFFLFPLQTPPQTPTPGESMEDAHHSEPKQESCGADLLQNIMNIKNECSPVSLNTVQVSWMNPVAVPQGSPQEPRQDFHGGQVFSPPQKYPPFQVSGSPQMMDQASMYQCSPQNQSVEQPPLQHYPHNPALEYGPYSRTSQSSSYEVSFFDNQQPQFCPNSTPAALLCDRGESENINLPIQTSPSMQQQNDAHLQNFSLISDNACQALGSRDADATSLNPFQSISNSMNTTQLGKSLFQWQVEQEESKLANISQDQFLSKDADGDT